MVGSSVILVPGVPGSNSTAVNSLFLCHFFFLKVRTAKNLKVFHMNGDGLRTCAPVKSIKTSQQVFIGFKNLPAGFYRELKTSSWPKYVLKWALGNRNLHKKFNNILQAEAEKLSGFTPSTIQPRPQAEGCMRGVKPDNFEAEACNIFKFFQLLSPVIEALSKSFFRRRKSCGEKNRVF